jgi:AhpD family alkylhydroperoxidase
MTQRLEHDKVAPDAMQAMLALEGYVRRSGLDHGLLHLVKLRASILNGCAFCVDLHWRDARAQGETEQRLAALAVWRESPFFTDAERALLAWTDAVTRLGAEGVPDDVYATARAHYDEATLVRLTMAVIAINGWNRLAVSFRKQPAVERAAAAA